MADVCPVCHLPANKAERLLEGDIFYDYSCQLCGNYSILDIQKDAIRSLLNNDRQKIAALSHWVRIKNEVTSPGERGRKDKIVLTEELIKSIIKQPPPSPAEQADKFVLWLGNSKYPPGEFIRVEPLTYQSIMGAVTPSGFGLVLYYLIDEGILKGDKLGSSCADITLSLKGWEYYEKLRRSASDSRKAFMAMKYNDAQLDKIVDDIFKPAVKQTGFDLVRLNDDPKAGLLDDRMRVEIQTSRFLIADLSHKNPGAYWEAGYAEGLGKPVIYTCEKTKFENPDTKPHFDTNHHLTIPWDSNNLQDAANQLKATIRATLPEAAKLTDD